ncbi:alpha/beta hydrolase [Marinobacterium arenosum]|uniref:alpha/beta hydrolase n=1 Tax=Marinobacterium arenosum TaxID=2862496 RepID=UPI001C976D5C|nr:alpha/beta fold hydrolase [Marinobacterium arenosum]MBY4678840.1 alpha/beta fold hydrolase [Marinobacterium arenosum]
MTTPPPFDNPDVVRRQQLRAQLGLEPWLQRRECFELSGLGIHCELYLHHPEAPTILFLPGIGTYVELYGELLGKLSRRGFNLVGIDLPGHGYSAGPRGEYSVKQVCQAVSATIDQLAEELHGGFGLFGFSIGALLALRAAEQEPRIDALLCGTLLLPDLPPDLVHLAGWQWTWGSAFFFPWLQVPLRSFVDFDLLLAGHPAGAAINSDPLIVFDYPLSTLSSLFSTRCGVVRNRYPFKAAILHGDRDEVLPLSYSERVIDHCRHPFELRVMPRTGHMAPWLCTDLMVEQAADWFAQSLG